MTPEPELKKFIRPNVKDCKSIGFWSVVFSGMLLFCGACNLITIAVLPVILTMVQETVGQAVQAEEKARAEQVAALEADAAKSASEAEKQAIEAQVTVLKSKPRMPQTMFNSFVPSLMKDRTLMTYQFADYLTGLVLNIVMLISGIGLLGLKEWARKLALWLAGVKILRHFVLAAVSILVVIPATHERTKKMMEQVDAEMKASAPGGGNVGVNAPQGMIQVIAMMDAMKSLAAIGPIVYALFAIIWPVVVLIMLNRPSVRAACLAADLNRLE